MKVNKFEARLSREELSKILDYDPKTGKFTWLVRVSKRVPPGKEAGTVKVTSAGGKPYRSIFIGGTIMAARLAWFMHYGEWPARMIRFIDGDTLNLRIDNLKIADYSHDKEIVEGKVVYRKPKDASRHYHLNGTFGIGLTEYAEMYAAQGGVCYLCGNPETVVRKGKLQPLAVDHCHAKGHVRKLLCHACNNGLGAFKDNPEVLRKAAAYLEDH